MVIASLPYMVYRLMKCFIGILHFQIAGETYTALFAKKHKNKPTEKVDTNDLE